METTYDIVIIYDIKGTSFEREKLFSIKTYEELFEKLMNDIIKQSNIEIPINIQRDIYTNSKYISFDNIINNLGGKVKLSLMIDMVLFEKSCGEYLTHDEDTENTKRDITSSAFSNIANRNITRSAINMLNRFFPW